MPATAPRDATIAVVGEGFGSLIIHSTAMYLGFRPEDVTIYGPNDNPVATYQQYAYNLGQTVLRSESESHFLPADWPTFAELNAWSHRNPGVLFRSARRKYNPGVAEILAEAGVVTRRLNWDASRVPCRIGWLQREAGPPPHFVLYDEQANFVGRAKHVMLALGHGPLASPAAGESARGTRLRRPHRPGLRVEAVLPGRPLHRHRGGDRLGQRVGQRARRGRQGAGAAAQPGAGGAGPERPALPVRGARHRRLPGAGFRHPDRVPGHRPQGHDAERRAWLARIQKGRAGGPLRGDLRRDRQGRARAGGPAGPSRARSSPRSAGSTSPGSSPGPASTSRR